MEFRLKTIIGVLLLGTLFHQPAVAAETFFAPASCKPDDLSIVVINESKEVQKLWTQVREKNDIDEIQYAVEAHSKLRISGADFLKSAQSFSVKSLANNSVQVLLQCADAGSEVYLSSYTSPHLVHNLPTPSTNLKISLLNLFLKSNLITLRAFDSAGVVIEEKSIALQDFYDTESLKWILARPASSLEVIAEERRKTILKAGVIGREKAMAVHKSRRKSS